MNLDFKPIAKPWRWLFVLILFVLAGLFYAQKINLTAVDLGRHIKNGEVFFEKLYPISTNFYSYTEPSYPAVNHHWATGAIFYLLQKTIGFKGLSLFYILLNLATFFFFFRVAQKNSNFNLAYFFAILSIPLICTRTEIRPEVFSYLLLGVYLYLLYKFKQKKISFRTILVILSLLQILWVNLHIFFIMGLFLIGVFLCDSWICEKDKRLIKQYLFLLLVLVAACFINPFGFKGVLTPLTIFKEYGYMIAENQSVIFMQKRFLKPVYFYFEFIFLITLISFVGIAFRKKLKYCIVPLLLAIFFGAFAWRTVRSLPLFGLFFLPIVADNSYHLIQHYSIKTRKFIQIFIFVLSVGLLVLMGFFLKQHHSQFRNIKGLGLIPDVQLSATFFKQNQIEGPIFNNYDIGGYLIYYLFPEHRVFVDNRPEAYSVAFFKETYVPMQEDEEVWENVDSQYNFNAIYFYRHDYTPWAQPFLIKRIQDTQWAPVFVDNYTLILLKRNAKNRRLIQLYELPQGIFQVRK